MYHARGKLALCKNLWNFINMCTGNLLEMLVVFVDTLGRVKLAHF